jgi:general secretion pathway protein A
VNSAENEKDPAADSSIRTADSEAVNGASDLLLEYFGLHEQPFGVTPDPRFLYLGSKHRQALAALDYGTKSNRGFIALIAQPGMGKTSLLYQYLESLRDKARTAFIFQTDGDSSEFMRYVLADLGLNGFGKDLSEMRSMLNEVLLTEMHAGRRFILIIDEAQNLDEKVLESVRLLSNFETPWAKLMQIVLAGQPQLAERLGRVSMTQLRQRISLFIKLEPFSFEEIEAYIGHRLQFAGYSGPRLFTAGALDLISDYSKGIPRTINNVCFAAMSLASMLESSTIDRNLVADVLADLGPELPPPQNAAFVGEVEPTPERAPEPAPEPPPVVLPVRDLRAEEPLIPVANLADTVDPKPNQVRAGAAEPLLAAPSVASVLPRWPVRITAIALFLLALVWSLAYEAGPAWRVPSAEVPALSGAAVGPSGPGGSQVANASHTGIPAGRSDAAVGQ